MTYAINMVPVSPVRSAPSHKAEMVSQLLFGEAMQVIAEEKEWLHISCIHDGYEGWCHRSHIQFADELSSVSPLLAGDWDNKVMFRDAVMHIPMGSQLQYMGLIDGTHDSAGITGLDIVKPVPFNGDALIARAKMFLNTAYLWGGRSVYGVDCSGFCQVVYSFFQKYLPRDAWQQALEGEAIGFLQEARAGDLAFFDNEEGRITHVGILIDASTIIHASGKVRIDKIDPAGILNMDTNTRTHRLRVVKRVVTSD